MVEAVASADRQRQCFAHFDARVRHEIKALIDDVLIEEHRRSPGGRHSDALERVLNYFRRASTVGKYAILAVKPFADYRILALSAQRGVAPRVVDNQSYASMDEAYHAVFLKRVQDLLQS